MLYTKLCEARMTNVSRALIGKLHCETLAEVKFLVYVSFLSGFGVKCFEHVRGIVRDRVKYTLEALNKNPKMHY